MSIIYEKMTLYRRSPIWIQHQFDLDNSEKSINKNYLTYRGYGHIIEPERPDHIWPAGSFGCFLTQCEDGSKYWSLLSRGGWFEISLLEEYNQYKIYEVIYEYANPGIGELRVWFNGELTEVSLGPSSWLTSIPHKAIDGIYMKCRQRNFGKSDPSPHGEIDNLRVYYYTPIGEVSKYSPPKTSVTPTAVQTLRGHSRFQTTKYLGMENAMTIRFYDEESHNDFHLYADRPHVLCDDKGIFYRGIIELGENRYFGSGLYEQEINFKSSNKLGEGWI